MRHIMLDEVQMYPSYGTNGTYDTNRDSELFQAMSSNRAQWSALLFAVTSAACRARTPSTPAVDWKPAARVPAERAALLLLDEQGLTKVECLPGRTSQPSKLPEIAVANLLDVGWNDVLRVAGWAAAAAGGCSSREVVVLVPGQAPRRLACEVVTARFSPDGGALAYEVAQPVEGKLDAPTTYVLELESGKISELGALKDPRWEADGNHLRATRLRTVAEETGANPARWTSLRVRWNRQSGVLAADGPGSAQIPAPAAQAVAWSERPPSTASSGSCSVTLSPGPGVRHTVLGRFCMGSADERGVRWSHDGRWLAFPHPGPVPGQRAIGQSFLDVVGTAGGRYAELSALYASSSPADVAIVTNREPVWLDWSPSGRFLAVQDSANDLRVFDFEAHGVVSLGKARAPTWSPGGSYLLVFAPPPLGTVRAEGSTQEAFVLAGAAPSMAMAVGRVRDARWLPPEACERP